MMIYVQCATPLALPLSAALFQLMRPPHLRDERDGSLYYCEVIDHPSNNGWSILALPENEFVPIHVEADATYLSEILSQFVLGGGLTQEESDGIVAGVTAAAGTQVRVADFIPPSWGPYTYATREAAQAAGYFPAEEE